MTTQEKLIKGKLGLLELAAYMENVSEACKTLGYSRDTFYRVKRRYEVSLLTGIPHQFSRPFPTRVLRAHYDTCDRAWLAPPPLSLPASAAAAPGRWSLR